MNEFAVQARGLAVRFGCKRVLEGLNLDVPSGSVTALVGPNGAGKSTLLRILVGALVPNGGRASVLGLDPAREGPRVRARAGYVPDRFEVPRWMRGRDWLRFLARFYASWSVDEEQRLLGLLQLDPSDKIADLSKGARAKLALIAALAHRPKLLLLDEPFSGLDVSARDAIATAIFGHLREESRTVLFVSHSLSDVERLADRIAILEGGRVVRAGELETVARAAGGGVDLQSALRAVPASIQPVEVA